MVAALQAIHPPAPDRNSQCSRQQAQQYKAAMQGKDRQSSCHTQICNTLTPYMPHVDAFIQVRQTVRSPMMQPRSPVSTRFGGCRACMHQLRVQTTLQLLRRPLRPLQPGPSLMVVVR